jgi:hypothetical protein
LFQDLDSIPEVSENISHIYYEKVNSQTVLPRTDQAPLSFFIEGRDNYMIDVKNIEMCLAVRIRRYNTNTGAVQDLTDQELVAPYCGFLYTFWKVINIYFLI